MLGAENGEQLIFSELSAKDHDGIPKASKLLNCVYTDRPIDLALAWAANFTKEEEEQEAALSEEEEEEKNSKNKKERRKKKKKKKKKKKREKNLLKAATWPQSIQFFLISEVRRKEVEHFSKGEKEEEISCLATAMLSRLLKIGVKLRTGQKEEHTSFPAAR
ncbi:RNA-binding (RRM/RBD/RNP motifs) family protein [Actinidia rufa]|uniref:RNA-binding (RRM/RBD/RNP motifs) family protein n=1 Tax=Actinidia rufa TaxID=165716 RepID=A0A7J0F9R9_9ERIC|nr:RNA-binding (RRM/RBD/RNP motifs) family protein [Actinidia rufa]